MSALVRIQDVHKHFTRGSERIDVLKGVNLEIPQGDFLALMGPSGSGKTTLLNLMGGLDAPTGGGVEVAGVQIGKLGGSQLSRWRSQNIGFIFQLYNLLPVLTAERNVELPLLLTKLSKAERSASAWLDRWTMAKTVTSKPSSFSSSRPRYPLMKPASSSARTRRRQGGAEMPTRRANSTLVMRPSS